MSRPTQRIVQSIIAGLCSGMAVWYLGYAGSLFAPLFGILSVSVAVTAAVLAVMP